MTDAFASRGAPPLAEAVVSMPMQEFVAKLTAPPSPWMRGPRRWLLFGVIIAFVLMTAASVVMVLRKPPPLAPDAWDPAIRPFAEFVEKQRGLEFEHPVYVDLLSGSEFMEQSSPSDIDVVGQDREAIDRTVRLLRAAGLVSGELDLFDSRDRFRGERALGSYSYVDQRVRLRGTELTPALQWTLVHELTHALEDQHVDLGARLEELASEPARQETFRALMEGDAGRVQQLWADSLDDEGRQSLEADVARTTTSPGSGTVRVPPVVRSFVRAPTAFSQSLLAAVIERARPVSDADAIDTLFLTPPATQEHLLDPWSLVIDHEGALAVPQPALLPGDKVFDKGTFGALSWLFLLSERLPAQEAFDAADGWGGDAFVAYERVADSCLAVTYAADTPRDLAQMRRALRTWVAKAAPGSAEVRDEGARLTLVACSRGASQTTDGTGGSRDAIALAILRSQVSIRLLHEGVDIATARCATDGLVRHLSVAALSDLSVDDPRVERQVAPCRPAGQS